MSISHLHSKRLNQDHSVWVYETVGFADRGIRNNRSIHIQKEHHQLCKAGDALSGTSEHYSTVNSDIIPIAIWGGPSPPGTD